MFYSNESVKNFLSRCRSRIDEELDAASNFWSQSELVEYMNEGMSEVWQAVRETHENWFVKELASTDVRQRIGGRDYNPKELRLEQGRTRLLLPPDFRELLFIEGIPPVSNQEGDQFFPVVRFEYRNLTQRAFREEALNTVTTNVRLYLYDVVFGMDGAYILFSPPLALSETIDARIKYIAAPVELRYADTFEKTGFTKEMVAALLRYVLYAAAQKEGVVENITVAERMWNLKRELAVRSAGPKQTRDEETVEGYLEDEL